MSKHTLDDDLKIEIVRLKTQENLSNRAIGSRMGISRSTIDNFIGRRTYRDWWAEYDKQPIATGTIENPIKKRIQNVAKVVIIASAQNNTFVHDKFWTALMKYKEHRDAEMMVGTFSYSHGHAKSVKGSGWYDKKVRPYIIDKPVQLAPGLVFCGELNIRPTAVNPLHGMHSYTQGESMIIPSVKQNMESVATPRDRDPIFMYCSGAVTQRNYIQRTAGQKADFLHIFGALVVEIMDDGRWFVRQLNADSETGEFYDLDLHVTCDGVSKSEKCPGIIPGDIHTENINPAVAETLLGVRTICDEVGNPKSFRKHPTAYSVIDVLKPEWVVCHDILDFKNRNHHNYGNPHFMYRQWVQWAESIESELQHVGELLRAIQREQTIPVVVSSNHDRALERYLTDHRRDWYEDPVNAEFYLRTQLEFYRRIRKGLEFHPVEWNIERLVGPIGAYFLDQDASFQIAGNECGQHGDIGANGARGSINAFTRMGEKFVIGHSHSAGIKDGVFQVGITCKDDPDYAKGASSWSHTFCIIYPNGKRTLVTMKKDVKGNYDWRL